MKKFNFCHPFFLTLAFIFIVSVNAFAQKPNTFLITADDQKHYIYGDNITWSGGDLFYTGEDGKEKKQKSGTMKLVYTGSKVFYGVTPYKDKSFFSLREIIAFNNNYVLLENSYTGEDIISVYKRSDLSVQKLKYEENGKEKEEISFFYGKINSKKSGLEKISINMTKYFPECPELVEKQIKNIESGNPVNSGIAYYNCGNAPDFFSNKVEEKTPSKTEEKATEETKEEEQFIMTNEGEKITIAAFYRAPQNIAIQYYEKLGATAMSGIKVINTSKVKYTFFGGEIFMPFKNANGKLNMMEIVAYSSKKILTYDHSKSTYSVYDRKNTLLVGGIKKENILPLVQDHFADCKDLLSHVEEAAKLHRDPKNGMTNFNCNNAPTLITK